MAKLGPGGGEERDSASEVSIQGSVYCFILSAVSLGCEREAEGTVTQEREMTETFLL